MKRPPDIPLLDGNQSRRLRSMRNALLDFRTESDFPGIGPKTFELFRNLKLLEQGLEEGQGDVVAYKLTALGCRTLSYYSGHQVT